MTSFEHNTNSSLIDPESARALHDYCAEITEQISPEERQRRQDLLASSALADARMDRENNQIIGSIDVEE